MAEYEVKTAMIVGASRTLGLGLADAYLRAGWNVIATARTSPAPGLEELATSAPGRLRVEELDMTDPDGVRALRGRLAGEQLDLLFVNAAITNGDEPVNVVSEETFTTVMVTNAYAPLQIIESFGDLVGPTGVLGIMSSSQGSISLNTNGGHEVYRASKAALNQLMRSYAARHAHDPRALVLVNPGWVKTELGGAGAQLTVDESIPGVVAAIEAQRGTPGLHFVDHRGQVVPW